VEPTEEALPMGKQQGHEAEHSPPERWSYISTSPYAFMAQCFTNDLFLSYCLHLQVKWKQHVRLKHEAFSKLQDVRTQKTVHIISGPLIYFNVESRIVCFNILAVQDKEEGRCSKDRRPEIYNTNRSFVV
jgi:hypothetical protein